MTNLDLHTRAIARLEAQLGAAVEQVARAAIEAERRSR